MQGREPNVEFPSLELLYIEVRDRLIRQSRTIEHINAKASLLFGAAIVLLLVILGRSLALIQHSGTYPALFFSSSICTLTSLAYSALVLRPKDYGEVLRPRGAHNELICLSPEESMLQLLHSMIDSFEKNEDVINTEVRWVRSSLWFLLGAMMLTTASVTLYIFSVV